MREFNKYFLPLAVILTVLCGSYNVRAILIDEVDNESTPLSSRRTKHSNHAAGNSKKSPQEQPWYRNLTGYIDTAMPEEFSRTMAVLQYPIMPGLQYPIIPRLQYPFRWFSFPQNGRQ